MITAILIVLLLLLLAAMGFIYVIFVHLTLKKEYEDKLADARQTGELFRNTERLGKEVTHTTCSCNDLLVFFARHYTKQHRIFQTPCNEDKQR